MQLRVIVPRRLERAARAAQNRASLFWREYGMRFVFSMLFAFLPVAFAGDSPSLAETEAMTSIATGTFEVSLAPLDLHYDGGETQGRMGIEKTFHGDLDATSRGEMLTAMTDEKGSAVYVAIERVEGTVGGRRGSFVLHHRGIMNRGEQALEVHVVPDSGTGELKGLSGEMRIRIEDGKHHYTFDYALPGKP